MRRDRIISAPRKETTRRRLRPSSLDLPLLPVRDIVIFPSMVLPLFVGREASIRAVERAMSAGRRLVFVAQRQAAVEDPAPTDLYHVGTVVSILRMLKLPDGRLKLLVQGQSKAHIQTYTQLQPYYAVRCEALEDLRDLPESPLESEALVHLTRQQLERLLAMGRLMPPDVLILADNFKSPGRLADLILANLGVDVEEAQQMLELRDPCGVCAKWASSSIKSWK